MLDRILKFSFIAFLLSSMVGLTACNTLEGAGEDIEAAGEEIDEEI